MRATVILLLLSCLPGLAGAFKTAISLECECETFDGASTCAKWKCIEHQACFPSDAELRDVSGNKVRMMDLAVGSELQGPKGSVDLVTNFIHREEALDAPFLRIRTDRGTLELSANHLAFIKSADGTRRSVLAGTIRVGDILLHRDGDAQVTSIEPFKARGVYAPLTRSGELEVNGFSTSCYANIPSHAAAHAMMMPLHYLPANHDGIHWYAKAWMHMYEAGKWVLSQL